MIKILNILLSHMMEEDELFWFYDAKDFYTARSGYHLANKLARGSNHGSSLVPILGGE